MCRVNTLGLLFLLFLSQSSGLRAEIDHAAARSVVQIRGIDSAGRMYFGSGVLTQKGMVATNCHVVRAGGRIGVYRGAETYRVVRVRSDTYHDLCIIEAPGITGHTARMARIATLKPGHTLHFYGFPRALGMSMSAGAVKRLLPFGGSRLIETDAFFTLGGSGGGIFDPQGRLVGLATFLAPGHGGTYYAIPSDWIAGVMTQRPEPVHPLQGLSFWEQPTALPAILRKPGL